MPETTTAVATAEPQTKKAYKNVFVRGITRSSGKYMNASLSVDDLAKYQNDKGFVNISFAPLKELGAFGKTHAQYVSVLDTGEPEDEEASTNDGAVQESTGE